MRYFIISSESSTIAIVFHDYKSGSIICRSKSKAFVQVLDAVKERAKVTLIRDGDTLQAVSSYVKSFNWVEDRLREVVRAVTAWDFEARDMADTELGIDRLVEHHLGAE